MNDEMLILQKHRGWISEKLAFGRALEKAERLSPASSVQTS